MKADTKNSRLERPLSPVPWDRRRFLKLMGVTGGGLIISFLVGASQALARMPRAGFLGAHIPEDFNAFLRIGADERVLLLTGKIEMGQGPITSLPQMLADELDVSYDAVDIVMGDTDLCPWDAGTFGSLSTRHFGVFLREAAAEAKGVLKELAAEYLKCPVESLATENGVVFDTKQPENRVTYGNLTKGKIIERHLKDLPPLKAPEDLKVMGQSFLRRDSYEKVTGQAKYAADFQPKGLYYAKILRPPAHGAKLVKLDLSEAEKMDGVKIVREGDLVALLHQRPDLAAKALAAVKAEFTIPRTGINDENIFDHLVNTAPEPDVGDHKGNVEAGEGLADFIIEETYYDGYKAHAPMEPHAATATIEDGRILLHVSTQAPFTVRREVAGALKIPEEKVRVITPFVGGGFGGKVASRQAEEAAFLAKLTGLPVQVAWTRAEEFFYDTFRPASVVRIKSGVGKSGKMVLWDYHVYSAGTRGAEQFYEIPNYRIVSYGSWMEPGNGHPFAIGAWRAPGAATNIFAREVQMNLMAAKVGADPLEFRLSNLKDERMIRVWEAAAKSFGWKPGKLPSGRGYGLASGIDADTYVAFMVEIELDKNSGQVRVKRITCAQDMGLVVNPEGARIQMEGCLTMGLGYALTEDIRFSDGRLKDTNFDTYQLPVFSDLPKIETILVDNRQHPPTGGGEPAIIGLGGAIATAIHDITGAVPRQMPLTPARIKEAMAKG